MSDEFKRPPLLLKQTSSGNYLQANEMIFIRQQIVANTHTLSSTPCKDALPLMGLTDCLKLQCLACLNPYKEVKDDEINETMIEEDDDDWEQVEIDDLEQKVEEKEEESDSEDEIIPMMKKTSLKFKKESMQMSQMYEAEENKHYCRHQINRQLKKSSFNYTSVEPNYKNNKCDWMRRC